MLTRDKIAENEHTKDENLSTPLAGRYSIKDIPKWVFKKEYEKNLPDWYTSEIGEKLGWFAEHTPTTYMGKSVIWFSHLITQRLGKEKLKFMI